MDRSIDYTKSHCWVVSMGSKKATCEKLISLQKGYINSHNNKNCSLNDIFTFIFENVLEDSLSCNFDNKSRDSVDAIEFYKSLKSLSNIENVDSLIKNLSKTAVNALEEAFNASRQIVEKNVISR